MLEDGLIYLKDCYIGNKGTGSVTENCETSDLGLCVHCK